MINDCGGYLSTVVVVCDFYAVVYGYFYCVYVVRMMRWCVVLFFYYKALCSMQHILPHFYYDGIDETEKMMMIKIKYISLYS